MRQVSRTAGLAGPRRRAAACRLRGPPEGAEEPRSDLPWIFHLELQSSRDTGLSRRTLKYQVLTHDRHQLPVHSLVVLLRREADDPALTGELAYRSPADRGGLRFEFDVVRLWERPVEMILS